MAKVQGLITPPTVGDEAAEKSYVDTTIGGGVATGTVLPFAGTVVPSGYLLCDGSTISRTTYGSLNSILSASTPAYPYGNGDGSTTFHLPNIKQRIPIGRNAGGNTPTLGGSGGTLDHVHTTDHVHNISAHTHTQAHEHTLNAHTHTFSHTHTLANHVHSIAHNHTAQAHSHTHSLGTDASYYAAQGTNSHNHTLTVRSSTSNGTSNVRGSDNSGTVYNNANVTSSTDPNHSHTLSGVIGSGTGGDTGFSTTTPMTKGSASSIPAGYSAGPSTNTTDGIFNTTTTDSIVSDTTAGMSVASTAGSDTTNTGNPTTSNLVSTENPPYAVLNYIIKT